MSEDLDTTAKRKNARTSEQEVIDSVQAIDGIQVNHCKNPICENFNVPYTGRSDDPNYKRSGSVSATPPLHSNTKTINPHPSIGNKSILFIQCVKCGECPPLKNNSGISEVLNLWRYHPDNDSCPNQDCENHSVPLDTPGCYKRNGKTKSGTGRWLCKSCGTTFVERRKKRPARAHEKPYRYEDIVKACVNGTKFHRMKELYGVNPTSVYNYIENAYESCLRFTQNRESRLSQVLADRKIVYFATDRQDILINWSNRRNRSSIPLKATCSVEVTTRFILRYDVGIDDISNADKIHKDSIESGDVDKALIFRKYILSHRKLKSINDFRTRHIGRDNPTMRLATI